MPCGASTLLIQLVSQNGLGGFRIRAFTNNDINVVRDVAINVTSVKSHQFRVQAKVDDFKDINCPNPSFSGVLCYPKYIDSPDCEREKDLAIDNCKNEKVIEIVVPIVAAIIGAAGGIAGVLLKQRHDSKKSDSSKSPNSSNPPSSSSSLNSSNPPNSSNPLNSSNPPNSSNSPNTPNP
ncbi:hypothetical protein RclHR1_01450009 [Rhizophagus clarus]|nr:hypothetical protein RclHR1_01450009 [Rhizophagus clarus]